MGLGLEAGLSIDLVADQLVARLDQANNAALAGDIDPLSQALIACGEQLFEIRPRSRWLRPSCDGLLRGDSNIIHADLQ
jgi:hypothetical protein